MSAHYIHRRIISHEAGFWVGPVRGALRLLESFYRMVIDARNQRYDRRGSDQKLDVPVISVGNITVGGTGKTPFVIELLGRLERMGMSAAVVSRGYGSATGEPNDEELLIKQRVPGALCIADRNRGRGAQRAHDQFDANVVILDDGFQHRALARDLDIVLIDSTCPFGFHHLLPRGLLREPVESLRRAHLIVLTRCDQVSAYALEAIENDIDVIGVDARRIRCRHRVTGIERLEGGKTDESLEGRRAVLFAGIGQPDSFVTTARALGLRIVGERWYPDHHRYSRRDLDRLLGTGAFPPHDLLLTTEKDAVKLRSIRGFDHARVFVVRVDIDFLDEGGTIVEEAVRKAVGFPSSSERASATASGFGSHSL